MANTRKVITGTIVSISATPVYGTRVEIGRALGIRINESYRATPLFQLGQMHAHEIPILQYSGSMSISKMVIDLSENILSQFSRTSNAAGRPQNVQEFVRQLLFSEGVNVDVNRIVGPAENTALVPSSEPQTERLLSVRGAVCTGETLSIESNEIVTTGGEFLFREPITVGAVVP